MKPAFLVRPILAEETLPIRWPVLRAGLAREAAIFLGDSDPATCHLGAFAEGELCGVVTIYPAPLPEAPEQTGAWQLRGMAILPKWQGKGAGHELIQACMEKVRSRSGSMIWCNARVVALKFYLREGFTVLGTEFEIPTAGPHFRMSLPCGVP